MHCVVPLRHNWPLCAPAQCLLRCLILMQTQKSYHLTGVLCPYAHSPSVIEVPSKLLHYHPPLPFEKGQMSLNYSIVSGLRFYGLHHVPAKEAICDALPTQKNLSIAS